MLMSKTLNLQIFFDTVLEIVWEKLLEEKIQQNYWRLANVKGFRMDLQWRKSVNRS